MTDAKAAEQLRDWAAERFGELTPAEDKLLEKAPTGDECDVSSGDADIDDPAKADNWTDDRMVRAELIRWLCVDPDASKLVDVKGIRLEGARIDGALDLDDAKISFGLHLVKCRILEPLTLRGADVWRVDLGGSHTRSIIMDGAIVHQDVILNAGFTAQGEVRLFVASIGGNLECDGASFKNKGGDALSADQMTVEGGVYLKNDFKAQGEVRLLGASIGNLECDGGTFENEGGDALSADRLTVKGSVFLRDDFTAQGEVRLLGASIGGNLDCIKGTFENEGGFALNADGMTVRGAVFLRNGFTTQGEVRLLGASIGIDLDCSGGTFENEGEDKHALSANRMTVKGGLFLRGGFSASGSVHLVHASVGVLVDDKDAWPESSRKKLDLDGFQYGAISATAPTDAAFRIRWLELQDQEKHGFLPKPYEQLAKVLREMGHPSDAKTVMIAKEKARRKYGGVRWWGWPWHWVLGAFIGYGYRTERAGFYLAGLLALGAVLFALGHDRGIMWPTERSAIDTPNVEDAPDESVAAKAPYQTFNAFVFSADTLIPLIDLHQQKYWLPDPRRNPPWGKRLRWYLWVHIAAGWFFSTMVVIGVTGLARPG